MANVDIIARLQQALDRYERGACSAGELAAAVEVNGEALERLPFPTRKRLQYLALRLQQEQWKEEEGLVTTMEPLLEEYRACLTELPR